MKKVLSLVLALAMVLALAVPAFATTQAVTDSTPAEIELDAAVGAITLDVTLPAAVDPNLNPYGLEVGASKDTSQIISEAMFIENASAVDVRVDVTATGTPTAGVTLATATANNPAKPVTTKSIYAYFEIMEATNGSTAPTWAATADTKAANIIPIAAKATTKTNVITMAKKGTTSSFAAFHIGGDMAPAPTTAWTTDDKVTIKLAFTFYPTTKATS